MAVYFIRAGEDGPVKIGHASDVQARIRELQCGNHLELTLLRTLEGGQPVEAKLHSRYTHLRSRGEWFAFHPDMLVVELASLPDDPSQSDAVDPELLAEVEAALVRLNMSPTRLGREAVGDPNIVRRLRTGKDMQLRSARRLKEFIAAQ